MRLRNKVAIIVLITWGLMFVIAYLGSSQILRNSYLQLEQQQADDNVNRVYEAMNQMLVAVKTMDVNWAVWDDTYKFIVDKNEAYIKSNLPPASFSSANVDIMLFYNAKGEAVFAKAVNADRTEYAPLPSKLDEYLTPTSKLVHMPNLDSNTTGLIDIPSGILFVSGNAVVTSKNEGPVHGSLIMARYFTQEAITKISEVTKLNVTMHRIEDINKNSPWTNIEETLAKTSSGSLVNIKNENTLVGYKLLRDINDKPIAILEIIMNRSVYNAGVATIRYYNIAFFSVGIVLTVLLMYLLHVFIVRRLEKLNLEITEISDKKEFFLKVGQSGTDEVSSLSSQINHMLDVIQDYDVDQKKLLTRIKNELDQVNKYSIKLKEAENLLRSVINSMPSALAIINSKSEVSLLNPIALNMLGMKEEEVIGKSLFNLFPFLNNYKDKFEHSLKGNVPLSIEKIMVPNPNSNVTRYYDAITYAFTKDNERFLTVRLDDITDQISLEQTLTQNEKLAALGVLTAGIAHEINNPINFLSATISPLKNNLDEIVGTLKQFIEIKPGDKDTDKKLSEISEYMQSINLDFSIKETFQLIDSIKEGASRTTAIVRDLRTFSRVDEDVMKKADINQGIQSTLNLLKHKCKDKITIHTEFNDIPLVDCFPGKINQVFMNVISNAIDAIPKKGDITIKTKQENNNVVISIKDTGVGIPEKNMSKIFEPFFTTKEVGHGTGLGLSISFGIIRDHHGTIEVKSSGHGSEFIIKIPINHHDMKG